MAEKIELPRVPEMAGEIQVNFCRVPSCHNFGLVPSQDRQSRGKHRGEAEIDVYRKTGNGKDIVGFFCKACETIFTVKSNIGINEEHERLKAYLAPQPEASCPEPDCPNHLVPIKGNKSFYHSYGKSPSGYHKYRCKLCKRYFTVGTPSRGQKKHHLNIEIFRCLVGKMPIRCIAEKLNIGPATVYSKIDFIHKQALAFVANRERKLLGGMDIPELQVAVDRQEYVVNWKSQADKRNTRLMAVGSADNITGYVFGMHLNFDSSLDAKEIEVDAVLRGDYSVPYAYRRYARLWLNGDYEESVKRSVQRKKRVQVDAGEVNEELDKQDGTTRLPAKGMQIHAEYTLFGHFLLLKELFKGTQKVTFYMDEEAGIQGACNSAFERKIREGDCQAFVVEINKEMTINQRRRAVRDAYAALRLLRDHYDPGGYGLSYRDVAIMHLEEQIRQLRSYYFKAEGYRPVDWKKHRLGHPLPGMSEPEKKVNYLTESLSELPPDKLAVLFCNATLGGIDRFFMQIRRKLSLMERPIGTASNKRRIWYGYSPYNPAIIQKIIDIYRVYYNYVKVGNDKQTPAMRLGIARSPIEMKDILYYS